MFLPPPAGKLQPRGLDHGLLVKLTVDRTGSCRGIPRKLSPCLPLTERDREGKAIEKESSD